MFVVLACVALVGHFVQVGHFLGTPHVVGADGELHHACGHRHTADEPDTDPSPEPDDRDRCPLLPPGLEPCYDAAAPAEVPAPAPRPVAVLLRTSDSQDDDVLAYAPKHSPPLRRRS